MKKIDPSARYKDTEMWVRKNGEYFVIGITDFSQKVFGDVNFIELPEVGRYLKRDEQFAVIESDKTATDIHTPISGKIMRINEELMSYPEGINQEPYNFWIVELDCDQVEEFDELDAAETYAESIRMFFNKT